MYLILFNPLSRNGKNHKLVKKIEKKLLKNNIKSKSINIIEITDTKLFLKSCEEYSAFVVVGGDGTLSRLINEIKDIKINQDIYMYKAGTGNDFLRSITRKKGLVNIKKYLNNLPVVTFNNKEVTALNGVGLGLDGLVCHKVNNSRLKKNKMNYFRHAIKSFNEFVPKSSMISVNSENIFVERTWFVSVMNAKYFGGGMKIAPKAKRDSEFLDLVIIQKVPKWLLIFIFPTIYLGLHTIFKKYVRIVKTKEVTIDFSFNSIMQIDGEDFVDVNKITVKK